MGVGISGLTADGRSLVKYKKFYLLLFLFVIIFVYYTLLLKFSFNLFTSYSFIFRYMRTEALNHKYTFGTPIQAGRIVVDLADMHQRCTQYYVRRPYGVGLLVAAYDQTGPHLYATEPSGNYYEYYAMAMGSRSQTSRTYLEKEFANFPNCSLDDLIKHGLKALAVSLSGDVELDAQSASIAIVGKDQSFKVILLISISFIIPIHLLLFINLFTLPIHFYS